MSAGIPDAVRDQIACVECRRWTRGMRFSAQVQQTPIPLEGNLIKWSRFEPYDIAPDPSQGVIIQSWDTAEEIGAANAYSVCLTFLRVGWRHYLLHVLREKLHYPELKRRVVVTPQRGTRALS